MANAEVGSPSCLKLECLRGGRLKEAKGPNSPDPKFPLLFCSPWADSRPSYISLLGLFFFFLKGILFLKGMNSSLRIILFPALFSSLLLQKNEQSITYFMGFLG